MPQVHSNGIAIEYEVHGPEDGDPLLLIHGVGAQLVRWPGALLDLFAQAGFRTIRFDNRDVGLSAHMTGAPVPDLRVVAEAQARGLEADLPYTLADMAADSVGLLDALGIDSAHVLGVSLGGMIAQVMALGHRHRVRSLALTMTHTGNPALPPSNPQALEKLATPAPDPRVDREAFLRHMVELNQVLGSPLYPAPDAETCQFAALAADRSYDPAGGARQLAAGRGGLDRRAALKGLAVPTLVIHGADDPLIPVEAGEELARLIPGAWLLRVNGMGHDLPEALFELIAGTVKANADRAGS